MRKLLILPLYFYALTSLFAQSWDGGGGDTDWNNALNWDTDMVPILGATVTFGQTVAVTGTLVPIPAQIRVNSNSILTLDLDMTVGDGTTAISAIQIGNNSSLIVPSGRTITVNPPDTNHGIINFASSANAQVTIASGATVNINMANHAVNIQNATFQFTNNGTLNIIDPSGIGVRINVSGAVFTNNGTLAIAGGDRDGIENNGSFVNGVGSNCVIGGVNQRGIDNMPGASFLNEGDIIITDILNTTNDGIFSNGDFTNAATGMITIDNMLDDGIDVIASTFINDGIIVTTTRSTPSLSNIGISVGSSSITGAFVNNGRIDADGGTGLSNGQAIKVFLGAGTASLTNNGEINLSGGNPNRSFFSQGVLINESSGTINTGEGWINVSSNSFVNNGLVTSTSVLNPAVFTGISSFSTNDGFFRYSTDASIPFASGPVGATITDNGINLNDPSEIAFDLVGGCNVTIAGAGATQDWLNSSGTVIGTGPDLVLNNDLPNDPAVITAADLPSVSIALSNFCAAAILPVELTHFDATAKTDHVLLEWETATETNNAYIAVERSTDAKEFTEIGRKEGNGTSYTSISYSLEDKSPAFGVNYYRLRQVDIDGTTAYSEFISANFKGEAGEGSIRLYPNYLPANGTLELDLRTSTTEVHHFSILNSQGQVMSNYTLTGGSLASIQIGNWPVGMYYLRSNEFSATLRFMLIH